MVPGANKPYDNESEVQKAFENQVLAKACPAGPWVSLSYGPKRRGGVKESVVWRWATGKNTPVHVDIARIKNGPPPTLCLFEVKSNVAYAVSQFGYLMLAVDFFRKTLPEDEKWQVLGYMVAPLNRKEENANQDKGELHLNFKTADIQTRCDNGELPHGEKKFDVVETFLRKSKLGLVLIDPPAGSNNWIETKGTDKECNINAVYVTHPAPDSSNGKDSETQLRKYVPDQFTTLTWQYSGRQD
jgi:hypothetical protein